MWPFDYFRSQSKLLLQIENLEFDLKSEKLFNESVTAMYQDAIHEVAILRKRLEDLQIRFTEYTGKDAKPVGDVIVDRPSLTKVSDTTAPFTTQPPSYTGAWVERKVETNTARIEPTMGTTTTTTSNDMLTGMILGNMMHTQPSSTAWAGPKPAMQMEEYTTPLRDPDRGTLIDRLPEAASLPESPKVDHTPSHGFHGSPSSSYDSDSGFSSSSSSSSSSSYDSGSSFSSSDSGFSSSSDF